MLVPPVIFIYPLNLKGLVVNDINVPERKVGILIKCFHNYKIKETELNLIFLIVANTF